MLPAWATVPVFWLLRYDIELLKAAPIVEQVGLVQVTNLLFGLTAKLFSELALNLDLRQDGFDLEFQIV